VLFTVIAGLIQRVDVTQVQLEHEAVVRADATAQGFEQLAATGLDAANAGEPPFGVGVGVDGQTKPV
jgi:hypothetical protein